MPRHQPELARVGVDTTNERALFLVAADRPDDVSEIMVAKNRPFTGYFVALIACDADASSVEELARLRRQSASPRHASASRRIVASATGVTCPPTSIVPEPFSVRTRT